MSEETKALSLKEKLFSETAQIKWQELQRFFAQGNLMLVAKDCNLVNVACHFAEDDRDRLLSMLDDGKVIQPSNDQARTWYEEDATLWSVVVAPFVLVQEL